jgi:hypothetical protein
MEFEWMTEEGERRRRIEGCERARRIGVKATEVTEQSSDVGAWWRLPALANPFAQSNQANQTKQKKKILMSDDEIIQEGTDPTLAAVNVKNVTLKTTR